MNSRRLQSLIDNPPPKSPYFSLPSVDNIDIHTTITTHFKYKRRTAPNTITKIWGESKKMTEENKTNFLASLLRFATIDFDAMARDMSIASGSQIKKRLSTIIRGQGLKLEGDQVVVAAADGENQITKTTEITVTEGVEDDAQEDAPTTIEGGVANTKVSKAAAKAAAKPTKKRKRVDGKAPKEVLKKKQKKAVEQSMQEEST